MQIFALVVVIVFIVILHELARRALMLVLSTAPTLSQRSPRRRCGPAHERFDPGWLSGFRHLSDLSRGVLIPVVPLRAAGPLTRVSVLVIVR
jgi:hypothetical protein